MSIESVDIRENGGNGSVAIQDPSTEVIEESEIERKRKEQFDAFIEKKLEQERFKLELEAGVSSEKVQHFAKPFENPFTKEQRAHTTLLFGGLTWRHEHLIEGALEGLGYKTKAVPTPDVDAFQLGKEYGNNGQCNPTYFTVGNLVQYLQGLEKDGMSKQEIIGNHIFLTAGACGPCRFGMYEAEYRLALRNSGFDGFRVVLFQQSGGLEQSDFEAGLELNLDFFLAILTAMNVGDMFNEIGYIIRPYEVNEGETNKNLDEILEHLHDVIKDKKRFQLEGNWKKLLSGIGFEGAVTQIGKFLDQLRGDHYTNALRYAGAQLNEIEVDRFRVKPIVKITGEFWAQTTEGDGNFNMFKFLEGEGAEVLVEPVGTWIMYMIHQFKQMLKDREGVMLDAEELLKPWRLDKRLGNYIHHKKRLGNMNIAEKIFGYEYARLQTALGNGLLHELVDQYELQRVGHPFYNSRAGGGEGHLEIAKNIYYTNKDLCHMVLSLKPFGCMPSAQSDGAQAAVVEKFKDMIFLPIETSGEGEINAHSRVQMALGNARIKAKQEFKDVLESTGKSLDELRAYVDENPVLKTPMYLIPKKKSVVGTAAKFVLHVNDLMNGTTQFAA